MTRRLEREVGSAFRVLYAKPSEDPNCRVNSVVEIEADSEANAM